MDVLRFRSNFPTLWHPVDYWRYKRNFQPKLASPRKKPAYSSLKLTPAKFTEEFGVTINPPTLNLHNGNYFTFSDGKWVRTRHCKLRKGQRKPPNVPSIKPSPREPSREPKRERSAVKAKSKVDAIHSARSFKDQYLQDKKELEDYWKAKLDECERRHLEIEDKMRKEHENQMDAKQSQIDALIAKCNEYKGENNLLEIKVSKMMDMLAECAAEVNLQEAELQQVGRDSRRPSQKRTTVSTIPDGDVCGYIPRSANYEKPRVNVDYYDDEYEVEDD